MGPYYLDANGLVCWADARVADAAALDTTVGAAIQGLINSGERVAISEITLLEVHSTIHVHWRDLGRRNHDEAWADAAIEELMRWLKEGQLEMLPAPPKVAEMAMVNIEQVTRLGMRLSLPLKIRAWDAAHLYHATRWARDLGSKVTLVTGDKDIVSVVSQEAAFARYLEILNPYP